MPHIPQIPESWKKKREERELEEALSVEEGKHDDLLHGEGTDRADVATAANQENALDEEIAGLEQQAEWKQEQKEWKGEQKQKRQKIRKLKHPAVYETGDKLKKAGIALGKKTGEYISEKRGTPEDRKEHHAERREAAKVVFAKITTKAKEKGKSFAKSMKEQKQQDQSGEIRASGSGMNLLSGGRQGNLVGGGHIGMGIMNNDVMGSLTGHRKKDTGKNQPVKKQAGMSFGSAGSGIMNNDIMGMVVGKKNNKDNRRFF